MACMRTKVPQHWEEEEKRRGGGEKAKPLCAFLAVSRIPNDTDTINVAYFSTVSTAQHSFRQTSILYFVSIPHSVAEEQAPQ